MSRSYRKNAAVESNSSKKKMAKKTAIKKLRQFKGEVSSGAWYRRLGDQWDVKDYTGARLTLEDYLWGTEWQYDWYVSSRVRDIEIWEETQIKYPEVISRMKELEKEYEFFVDLGTRQKRYDMFGEIWNPFQFKLEIIREEYEPLEKYVKYRKKIYEKAKPQDPISFDEWLTKQKNEWKKNFKCK